jgi:hypothetical protein
MNYDSAILNHPIFIENKNEIEKHHDLNSFLKSTGIFITIVVLYEYPKENGKLENVINYHFKIEYWISKKDETHMNMGIPFKSKSFQNKEETIGQAILKAFDILGERKKSNIE